MKLENYRHYILNEFEHRKTRNPHYSLRAYARDLETSVSRLSESLNKKRGISYELAQKLVRHLNLEGLDADIFLLSVEAEHGRSQLQKSQAKTKLKEALASSEKEPLKTFTIVDWVAEALLKMNERENVADNIDKAATQLNVPSFMVIDAVRFLTRLGFISGAKKFKTYLQNRGKDRKLNVDYIQILEQAQKAYRGDRAHNYFQQDSLLLEKKDMAKAQRIISQANKEIRRLESKSKSAKVIFIANQIFSVETERKSK